MTSSVFAFMKSLSMARVHPQAPLVVLCMSSQRETFTIWMKSLVCQTNGLTVYDSSGAIVYRVENYEEKCSNEVYLMNLEGDIVYTIRKKNSLGFRYWDGYRSNDDKDTCIARNDKPYFQVKKYCRILNADLDCQVTAGNEKFWVVRLAGKLAFRVVNINEEIVAEVKQKQSPLGVSLGEDVLLLEVKPNIDHSLMVAIVTVYGLIRGKL